MEKHLTPKEKAEELFYKMLKHSFSDESVSALHRAKQCVLIAVDELIKESCKGSKFKDPYYQDGEIQYWIEVKQELNNL